MINMNEYAKRRKALMQKIGNDNLVVLPSNKEISRNGDANFPFRQQSDFFYLTGFDEPDAVLVLAPKRKEGEYILFNRRRDKAREIWDGPRAGQEGAKKAFLADQSYSIDELETILPDLLVGRKAVHYPLGSNKAFDKVLMKALNAIRSKVRTGIPFPQSFIDISPSVHEMRIFKSKAEITVMQKAIDITGEAHVRAMKACKPGMYEYELEAEIMHEFIRNGARYPAYGSIIGSGKNSCVLHYVANDKKIEKNDLVLIDAGAEYKNYAADITRTFPASGRFSKEQREIYELVLASQLAAIKTIKPGASWTAPQDAIVKVITKGLVDLGILKGKVNKLIEQQAYFPFYMHRSGHFLGLDVHDVGRYRVDNKWRKMEEGMVLTIEPGIYISADIPGVNKRWHNIGVRIEDDILVTKKGYDVLSKRIPKTVAEIEAVMAR